MRRGRWLIAGIGTAIGSWQLYVFKLRSSRAKLRREQAAQYSVVDDEHRLVRKTFFSGGVDEQVSESLQTGDVLLFSRNPLIQTPVNALLSATAQYLTPYCEKEMNGQVGKNRPGSSRRGQYSPFPKKPIHLGVDHCALVLVGSDGLPQILELSPDTNQIEMTPYDKRIALADEHTIILKKVRGVRTQDEEDHAKAFATSLGSGSPGGKASKHSVEHLNAKLGLGWALLVRAMDWVDAWNGWIHSAALVADFHNKMGFGMYRQTSLVLPADFLCSEDDVFLPAVYVRLK